MAATPGSIVCPPPFPGLSCPLQPLLLGSPCPLQYLLTLSSGFVSFKVSIWSMVHTKFDVYNLLPETQSSTQSQPLTFSRPLKLVSPSLTPTNTPKETVTQMLSYLLFFPTFFVQISEPALGGESFLLFPLCPISLLSEKSCHRRKQCLLDTVGENYEESSSNLALIC